MQKQTLYLKRIDTPADVDENTFYVYQSALATERYYSLVGDGDPGVSDQLGWYLCTVQELALPPNFQRIVWQENFDPLKTGPYKNEMIVSRGNVVLIRLISNIEPCVLDGNGELKCDGDDGIGSHYLKHECVVPLDFPNTNFEIVQTKSHNPEGSCPTAVTAQGEQNALIVGRISLIGLRNSEQLLQFPGWFRRIIRQRPHIYLVLTSLEHGQLVWYYARMHRNRHIRKFKDNFRKPLPSVFGMGKPRFIDAWHVFIITESRVTRAEKDARNLSDWLD